VPLFLDRTFIDDRSPNLSHTIRDFELDVFKIDAEISRETWTRKLKAIAGKLSKLFDGSNHLFRETEKIFLGDFEKIAAPVYLDGFWQNEKYFLSIADSLRNKDFIPVKPVSGLNSELLREMKSTSCASIHVRRNDYVTNADAAKFHGTCSVEYYELAAKMIAEKKGVNHFFVFSDEMEWVNANIHLPYKTTYVSHNVGRESHWDIFLMKNCNHHIIANSSFSWWGAWLNPSKDKMVIAPEKWFIDPASQKNEIIPDSWIKL